MSKREESKREKCQKRKEHNAKKANWRGMTNCQNNYNSSEAHFYITERVYFIAERRRQQRRKKQQQSF